MPDRPTTYAIVCWLLLLAMSVALSGLAAAHDTLPGDTELASCIQGLALPGAPPPGPGGLGDPGLLQQPELSPRPRDERPLPLRLSGLRGVLVPPAGGGPRLPRRRVLRRHRRQRPGQRLAGRAAG